MDKQLLFYEKVVPVSKQRHSKWAIEGGKNYKFAREVNSVPLMAVEFPQAAFEYTIVFTEKDDMVMPVVVLGFEANTNHFVDENGKWESRYLPAFVRRYPFIFSTNDESKTFTLCIDESYDGCSKTGKKGQPLFTPDGERTEFLEGLLKFVNGFQTEHRRTQEFCKHLKDIDLFEPMTAQITLPSGDQRSLTGFLAVSRDKLKALPAEKLQALAKNDALELVYLHLHSIGNFQNLVQRATEPPTNAAKSK